MRHTSNFVLVLIFAVGHLTQTGSASSQEKQATVLSLSQEIEQLVIQSPTIALSRVPFEVKVKALRKDGSTAKAFNGMAEVKGLEFETEAGQIEKIQTYQFKEGFLTVPDAIITETGTNAIIVESNGIKSQAQIRVLPGVWSLLPPLFAIALAFAARQVLISLFCGIWLGAFFICGYNPILGFMKTVDTYLVNSLADADHASILIFSLTLGGMIGVISKSGGTQGIVQKLSKYANHPRGGQLATWAMGILIFFDDYANTLIVGNTMRPFTDRLNISREKLSYIVDSTAAPVASLALVSTWIGFQIGLIDEAFKSLNVSHNAYHIFLQSIPYATYSILAIIFVFLIGITLRDFGPMRQAEIRAATSGKVLRDGAQPLTDSNALDMIADKDTPLRWYNALIPIVIVILATLLGLYFNGRAALGEAAKAAPLGNIFGEANAFHVISVILSNEKLKG
ncbi:MAG: Na+/H+ antiporter NhaC family protein, partial [bacterium]